MEIAAIDPLARRREVAVVYGEALGEPPDAVRAWRDEILPRHALRRDFQFLAALEGEEVAAIAYGYTGERGQWWTEHVARGLDEATRRAWVEAPHYEVVELLVRPARQRGGLGGRLLDALLAGQPHDRALLTADPERPQPLPFYVKHGWERLGEATFPPAGLRFVVLGKRLRG